MKENDQSSLTKMRQTCLIRKRQGALAWGLSGVCRFTECGFEFFQSIKVRESVSAPTIDESSERYFLSSGYGVYFDKNGTVISADLTSRLPCRVVEVNSDRIFIRLLDCTTIQERFFVVFEDRIFDCAKEAMQEDFILAKWNAIYLVGDGSDLTGYGMSASI